MSEIYPCCRLYHMLTLPLLCNIPQYEYTTVSLSIPSIYPPLSKPPQPLTWRTEHLPDCFPASSSVYLMSLLRSSARTLLLKYKLNHHTLLCSKCATSFPSQSKSHSFPHTPCQLSGLSCCSAPATRIKPCLRAFAPAVHLTPLTHTSAQLIPSLLMSTRVTSSVFVVACSGCLNKAPQTGRLQQQKFMISQSWRLEVHMQGAGKGAGLLLRGLSPGCTDGTPPGPPTLMTSFNLITLLKTLSPDSHI